MNKPTPQTKPKTIQLKSGYVVVQNNPTGDFRQWVIADEFGNILFEQDRLTSTSHIKDFAAVMAQPEVGKTAEECAEMVLSVYTTHTYSDFKVKGPALIQAAIDAAVAEKCAEPVWCENCKDQIMANDGVVCGTCAFTANAIREETIANLQTALAEKETQRANLVEALKQARTIFAAHNASA